MEYEDRKWEGGKEILTVRGLSSLAFNNVDFSVHEGEIFGIAGLAGAGRTETALAVFGYDASASGEMYLGGKKVRFQDPKDAIKSGIGYLTEDRKDAGLFLELNVASNIISANLDNLSSSGIMKDNDIFKICNEYVEKLNIRTTSIFQKTLNLSGGNQQKLLLARWIMKKLKVLIIDEPTRGVDVGAKSEIYDFIRKIAKNGTAVIVISSELPEVLTLCDRIMVMCQGRKTGELHHEEATEEKLMHLLAGLNG